MGVKALWSFFLKFARVGGRTQDLLVFVYFSLHSAAPKTTRLLLPPIILFLVKIGVSLCGINQFPIKQACLATLGQDDACKGDRLGTHCAAGMGSHHLAGSHINAA